MDEEKPRALKKGEVKMTTKVESDASPFSLNLGMQRRKKLFEKSLKESATRKSRVTIAQLIREALDKDLK